MESAIAVVVGQRLPEVHGEPLSLTWYTFCHLTAIGTRRSTSADRPFAAIDRSNHSPAAYWVTAPSAAQAPSRLCVKAHPGPLAPG